MNLPGLCTGSVVGGDVERTHASAIDRDTGVVAIKPSGVLYDELTVESIVFVSLQDGSVVRGDLRPSVDTETHLHLYRQRRSAR